MKKSFLDGTIKKHNILSTARLYVTSFLRSRREEEIFKDIETCCLFIGYPRIGHRIAELPSWRAIPLGIKGTDLEGFSQ